MYFKMNTSYSLVSQFDFSTTIFEEKKSFVQSNTYSNILHFED